MKKLLYIIILWFVATQCFAFNINTTDCDDADATTWCIQTTEQIVTDSDCGGTCSGGDTLYLEGGTRGELKFLGLDGGSSYITVLNDPATRVVIKSGDDGDGDGSGGGTGLGHLTIEDCKWLEIRGDNLSTHAWSSGCTSDSCYGIYVEQDGTEADEAGTVRIAGQSDHIKLGYIEVTETNMSTPRIAFFLQDGSEAKTWIWDTIEIHHSYVHDCGSGMYLGQNNADSNDDPYHSNMSVHHMLININGANGGDGSGIIFKSQSSGSGVDLIYDNIIKNTTGGSGIRVIDIFASANPSVKVYNNWVENSWGNGIKVEETNGLIYNNVILRSGYGDDSHADCFDGDGSTGRWCDQNYGIRSPKTPPGNGTVYAYNNTIVDTEEECIFSGSGGADSLVHKDNLLTNCDGGESGGGNLTEGTGAYANTYVALASDVGFVTWSDDSDYSNDDFDLTSGSSAVDAAGASGYPSDDFAGTSRPQGSEADDGAYEYSLYIYNALPADNDTDVAVGVTVTWTNPSGATSVTVYFDTNNPPTTQRSTGSLATSYDPASDLPVDTEHFYRVDVVHAAGTETGIVYSFTTAGGPPVMESNLSSMKYSSGGGAVKYSSGGMVIK